MSFPALALIVPGGDSELLGSTVESIRSETDGETAVMALPGPGLTEEQAAAAGIPVADSSSILGEEGIITFALSGDRLVPGALGTRMLTFENFPDAGVSFAGHDVVDGQGNLHRHVKPPTPGIPPGEILIRRTVEPSAVLVRGGSLESRDLELLARPTADIIVWERIAHDHGFQISGETAAEVRLDPERHGLSGGASISSLMEILAAAEGEDAEGESTLRRELLRRLYLAPESDGDPVDLNALFERKLASDEGARAVIADLQWLAERQSEALQLERLRWTEGELRPRDVTPVTVSEEVVEAQARLSEAGARTSQMSHSLERLEAEIYRRDAIISRLQNLPIAEAHDV